MRFVGVLLALVFGGGWFLTQAAPAAPAAADPWLFVSDIHLEASTNARTRPAAPGHDTNAALFESTVRAMQQADPHPPVVVVTGDLLAHVISRANSSPTAVRIARRLNAAFPDAQFVLALGNDDSACGDYALALDSPFLRDVASAWEPLVNRHGAAPGFRKSFAHNGFYTTSLPVPGLRAIVLDDVFWSPRYRAGCGRGTDAGAQALRQLKSALAVDRGPVWVLYHIPPGVDAFSTAQLLHRLAIVPFLTPAFRDGFLDALATARAHIVLAVAGHTHKFSFRIVDAGKPNAVPMLLVPSVSPVFRNRPSFLTADVDGGGTLHDVKLFSFGAGEWSNIGGMPSLGVDAFTAPNLVALHDRLNRDPALRDTFERLYEGGATPEINDRNWPIYWCASTAFATPAFRDCTQSGGYSVITRRGIEVLAAIAFFAVLLTGVIVRARRRRVRI